MLTQNHPSRYSNTQTLMEANGLFAEFNMPLALKSRGEGENEIAQGLPPYARQNIYSVDDYTASPEDWMRGNGTSSSYFVGVKPEHGMWLDFNKNHSHKHHVAVLLSIQGINPLTAQPTSDNKLEQYRQKCPVHDLEFGQDRYCDKCKYKWPPQNYLAGNATPRPYFWLDGFLTKQGITRQYVFTEDEARGVAAQILGDKRVFAIGITFYLSKEAKPPEPPVRPRQGFYFGEDMIMGSSGLDHVPSFRLRRSLGMNSATLGASESVLYRSSGPRASSNVRRAKNLEVAAGAKIHQQVYQDPETLEFWQPEAAATIYVNYAPEELVAAILAAGKLDREAHGEGPLAGLHVGQK